MSDCNYCDLRVKPDLEGRESPHKHGCPGLEIEMLRAEIEHLRSAITAMADDIRGREIIDTAHPAWRSFFEIEEQALQTKDTNTACGVKEADDSQAAIDARDTEAPHQDEVHLAQGLYVSREDYDRLMSPSEQDADDCEHMWGYRQGGFLLHCVKCGAIEENAMTEKGSE